MKVPLSKQRQLSASVAANHAEPANRLIGQHQSAATIDGVENDMHAGCQLVTELRRVKSQHFPAELFQEVVAPVIVCRRGPRVMIRVAVAFDVEIGLRTKDRKVEAVTRFAVAFPPLSLGVDVLLFHGSPQSIFQGTAVRQVVDLQRRGEFPPDCGDKNDSSPSPAVNRFRAHVDLA